MSRFLVCAGLLAFGGLFALAAADVAGLPLVAGARAQQVSAQPQPPRRAKRRAPARGYELQKGASPEEIARYFQLYGGFIDPSINKQSQGGPFDSGFFFDSGMGPNGGDSPYMN